MGAGVFKHDLRASGEVGEAMGKLGEGKEQGWLESYAGTEGTPHKRQDGVPSLRRPERSSSSGTGWRPHPSRYQGHGMRNGYSPHDKVDGDPPCQQDFVRWAPGWFLWVVVPTGHPMTGEQPEQDGPQLGKGQKDGALRLHSPHRGKNLGRQTTCWWWASVLVLSPCLLDCLHVLPDTVPWPEPLMGGLVRDALLLTLGQLPPLPFLWLPWPYFLHNTSVAPRRYCPVLIATSERKAPPPSVYLTPRVQVHI